MALQFIDGFDHYSAAGAPAGASMTQKWDATFFAGAMFPDVGTSRFGGQALRIESTAGSAWVQKSVITQRDEMIVGFAFLPKATGTHTTKIHFIYDTGDSAVLSLNMSSGGASILTTSGASAASAASTLVAGVWQYIEFRVKVDDTVGELEIKRNGVQIANGTSLDTGTTAEVIQSLRIESTSNLQTDHIDDLYLLDTTGSDNNTFLGDSRISVLYPSANGGSNDFTFTGVGVTANFEAVDELLIDEDTTYVESGLIGAREDYINEDFTDIGVVPTTVHGVQVCNGTLKTDTGTLRFQNEMTIAGTQYTDGTEITATSGEYHISTYIRDTDPSDNAVWTEAKVATTGSGCSITFRQI